jgi:hypothetical protein
VAGSIGGGQLGCQQGGVDAIAGIVSFFDDGVQTITIPPHRVIRQDYEIGGDGRLHQHSIQGLPVSFRIFEVDGRYLAARDDEVGYCNYEIEIVT